MKQEHVILSCDMHHASGYDPEARTHTFALEKDQFEIDLCANHAIEVHAMLREYIANARHIGKAPKVRIQPNRSMNQRRKSKAQRLWANQNGWNLSDRGRIPVDAVKAYEDAHRLRKTSV